MVIEKTIDRKRRKGRKEIWTKGRESEEKEYNRKKKG